MKPDLSTLSDRFLAKVAVDVAAGRLKTSALIAQIETNLADPGLIIGAEKREDFVRLLQWLRICQGGS